ncbi:MAG TPA: hypothetical protein VLS94_09090, partial [Fusibacter sp.]|nr:hypothetical protein [Fusibacter sp.]
PMTPISSGNPTINTPTSQQTDLTVNNNNNFRSTIKFTTKDYPTLSNDKDWRTYQRLLKAAANNHQTSEILASDKPNDPTDPNYLQKQSFMYNMFATNITTAKGRLCIRKHEEDMDAQKVYQELLKAYADDLSANLAASTLREHLTLLKFDDKWKGTYENFLNNWTTKIIELEALEDTNITDEQKRIWLTSTLIGNSNMQSAIRNAQTTELTFRGLQPTKREYKMPFDTFYDIILTSARMMDQERKANPKTNVQRSLRHPKDTPTPIKELEVNTTQQTKRNYTSYKGPTMQMKADMIFSKTDWRKLTKDQKETLISLKKAAKDEKQPSNTQTTVNQTQVNQGNTGTTKTTTGSPDIHFILSSKRSTTPASVNLNGQKYTLKACNIKYHVSNTSTTPSVGSLIDGGANGGMSGNDVRAINESMQRVDVTGIGNQSIQNVSLATVAGLIHTDKGPIIGIFNQYANYGEGATIHSSKQLKHFGSLVDDTPKSLGGRQALITPDGYVIPLQIRNGLAYMDIQQPSNIDMDTYPHVQFTSDMPWDPSILDEEFTIDELNTSPCIPTDTQFDIFEICFIV